MCVLGCPCYGFYLVPAAGNSRQVEFEVELPGGDWQSSVSLVVEERQANLDDFQEVHVAPQELVLVVRRASKFANGSSDDTWKFSVLQPTQS